MQNARIFYGFSIGNTESAAKQIQEEFGADITQSFDVAYAKASDIEQFSSIIFGSCTWA